MDLPSSLAAQHYATTRPATSAAPMADENAQKNSIAESFSQTVETGETAALAAMTNGADPHALVEALAQTELAVETAVTVRNKIVEAYQEILRMPV